MNALLLTVLLSTSANLSRIPDFYTGERIESYVVEKETGRPIEGAIVIAQWVLEGGPGANRVGTLRVAETVTDVNGRFVLEGWGPLARPKGGALDSDDPLLFVFKDGFVPNSVTNRINGAPGDGLYNSHRVSEWNGRKISMAARDISESAYLNKFNTYYNVLRKVFDTQGCLWLELPRATSVLETERQRQYKAGAKFSMIPPRAILASAGCNAKALPPGHNDAK